ncbi:hypothetical protein GCM10029964_109190 [Kibdelosporangium lantanae]
MFTRGCPRRTGLSPWRRRFWGREGAGRPAERAHRDNDIVVDTTHTPALECAREIVARLTEVDEPEVFERLRLTDR